MGRGTTTSLTALATAVALALVSVIAPVAVATPASGAVSVLPMDGHVEGSMPDTDVRFRPASPVRVPVPSGTHAVGLTWRQEIHDETTFRVRSLGPGGWSEWVTVAAEHDHGEDVTAPDARTGAGPIWTGPATSAVEIVSNGAPVRGLAVHTTGAGDDLVGGPVPIVEPAAGTQETIRPTSAWSSPGWSDANCPEGPETTGPVDAVVLHHTATTNAYTRDQVDDVLRSIHRFHTRTRGWCDIAYNVLVDRFGRAWEGRTGGRLLAVRGGHARGFNTATAGIALLGDHDAAGLPDAVADTVALVAGWKATANDFDPTGTVVRRSGGSTSIPAGVDVRIGRVSGHRDVSSTSCPGHHAYTRLDTIRARAADALTPPAPFRLVGGTPIVGSWTGAGPAAGTYLDGVFRLHTGLHTDGQEHVVRFGLPGDAPVHGDWDGDGVDTVGVLRGGRFHLLQTNRTPTGLALVDGDRTVSPAVPADFPLDRATPLAGDWDGDGVDTVGLAADGEVLLYGDPDAQQVLRRVRLGWPGDVLVALDWDADGTDEVSLRRDDVLYAPVEGDLRRLIAADRVPDDHGVFVADWSGLGLPTLVTVSPDGDWDPTTPPGI